MDRSEWLIREDEQTGIRVYELTDDDRTEQVQHRFYVVKWDESHAQVQSVVPNDCPDSGMWVSGGCRAASIWYVANGRTRENAMHWFRRIVAEERKYLS